MVRAAATSEPLDVVFASDSCGQITTSTLKMAASIVNLLPLGFFLPLKPENTVVEM